jgi:hypothetical protein
MGHLFGQDKLLYAKYLIINFYFYFHHRLAGLVGMLFSQQRKALVIVRLAKTP